MCSAESHTHVKLCTEHSRSRPLAGCILHIRAMLTPGVLRGSQCPQKETRRRRQSSTQTLIWKAHCFLKTAFIDFFLNLYNYPEQRCIYLFFGINFPKSRMNSTKDTCIFLYSICCITCSHIYFSDPFEIKLHATYIFTTFKLFNVCFLRIKRVSHMTTEYQPLEFQNWYNTFYLIYHPHSNLSFDPKLSFIALFPLQYRTLSSTTHCF